MRRLHLIRHGVHERGSDCLLGRLPRIPLAHKGRMQAQLLQARFRGEPITGIYTSPMLRCVDTANIIADGRKVTPTEHLIEIDYGYWSGRNIATLASDPQWQLWNKARSTTQTPGGDTIQRVASSLTQLLQHMPGEGTFLLVTHAEIIRIFICLALNLPLTQSQLFDVSEASCSTFEMLGDVTRCCCINSRVDL